MCFCKGVWHRAEGKTTDTGVWGLDRWNGKLSMESNRK